MNARAKDSIYGVLIIFAVLISMSAFAQYGQDLDHHKVEPEKKSEEVTPLNSDTNPSTQAAPVTSPVTKSKKNREVATMRKITRSINKNRTSN